MRRCLQDDLLYQWFNLTIVDCYSSPKMMYRVDMIAIFTLGASLDCRMVIHAALDC